MKKVVKRKSVRVSANPHGMDNDFIIMAGGGFILLVLIFALVVR